jgi:hypothetical protein
MRPAGTSNAIGSDTGARSEALAQSAARTA